jgi:two-component system, OmpR family, alkaline phosphatase synthesis response regulator PhoP
MIEAERMMYPHRKVIAIMSHKILIVDDEPSISMLIEFNLKLAGFQVHSVFDGEAVFDALESFKPDLIVLDLMLPKLDGIQVCRRIRSRSNMVPIIMLTALQDLSDKVAGLDNGADDYMTKPFSPQELVSRIHAILRRNQSYPAPAPLEAAPIQVGPITVNPGQREVHLDGRAIELTPKEFELLLFLCKHRGKVLSRQQLLQGVWDYHFIGDTRIVDVHISHLRDKIELNARTPEFIITIRNVGYKLLEQPSSKESLA